MIVTNSNRITDLLIKGLVILFIILISVPVRIINSIVEWQSNRKTIVMFLFGMLFLAGNHSHAQKFARFAGQYQLGFEGTFGMKSFTISSNIPEINNLRVLGEGGTLGIVWGSKGIVMKVRQGYYYSASSVVHTVDEVRSALSMNFYPLLFLNPDGRFRPYLLASAERNSFRMHGYYDQNDDQINNRSVSQDPYLGKIATLQACFGGGIEHRIKHPGYFIAFFGEVKYGKPMTTSTSNALFSETRLSGQLITSVGLSFGYYQ
jgi:hypothetical protein